MEKQEPQVAELIRGVQMIRVNVIAMKDDNQKEILDQRVCKVLKEILALQEQLDLKDLKVTQDQQGQLEQLA